MSYTVLALEVTINFISFCNSVLALCSVGKCTDLPSTCVQKPEGDLMWHSGSPAVHSWSSGPESFPTGAAQHLVR